MKHMNYLRSFSYWVILGLMPQFLMAQTSFVCDGEVHIVPYTGTFQDILIPDDPSVTQIEITAKGGDGGFAELSDDCVSKGGEGASLIVVFNIGSGADELRPGSILRFIVGQAGEKGTGAGVLGTGFTYGGGGGGTGILYKANGSSDWDILAVAGGGGGAYQGRIVGFCIDSEDGQGGRATYDGGDGNGDLGIGQGGPAGFGGLGGSDISGGGGGAYGDGTGILCIDFGGSITVGEGQAGFPEGGIGGGSEGCISFTFRNGGFGFGAGGSGIGAGGGGGGFSGGGGGGTTGRGGGGGSFIHPAGENDELVAGGASASTEDGYASYRCVRRSAPLAVCAATPVSLALDENGQATLDPAQLDGGSSHPDGLALAFSADNSTFNCGQLGNNEVVLTVTDPAGQSATCNAVVKVLDLLAPTISGPATVTIPCGDNASAFSAEVSASDNCDANPSLTYSDVLIDGNCNWACTIERTWIAKDQSGNQYTFVQTLQRTPGDLIESALLTDTDGDGIANPIVLGYSTRTLRIEAAAADCLVQWLPGSSSPSTPTYLPSGAQVVNGSNCAPSFLGFDGQGHLTNPMLSEALMLALKLRANPELASVKLSDLPCDIHPVLLQALSANATLGELLNVTNYALANIVFVSHRAYLVAALSCINGEIDFCQPLTDGSNSAPMAAQEPGIAQRLRGDGDSRVAQNSTHALRVFPNPARQSAAIDLSPFEGMELRLRIFNQQGILLQQITIKEAPAAPWQLSLDGLGSGLLALVADVEGQGLYNARLVVIKD